MGARYSHQMNDERPSHLNRIQEELQKYDSARLTLMFLSSMIWTYKTWANLLDGFPSGFQNRARMIIYQMPKTLDNFVTQPPIIMKTVGTYVGTKLNDFIEEVMLEDDDDDEY